MKNFKKEELYFELENQNFKIIITLTYPLECYPKEEKLIKEHLTLFTEKIRKLSKKKKIVYFYVYELKWNIQIHLLLSIEETQKIEKLKKDWLKIIGTTKKESLSFIKVDKIELEKYCNYILKKNNELVKKLGSKLFGSSEEFKILLKKLKTNSLTIDIEKPQNSKSLDNILKDLKKEYINEEKLEEELILELRDYELAYNKIQYQDINDFLKRGVSKISKGYLQFFNLIKDISSELLIDFKLLLRNWYQNKKRENIKTTLIIEAFKLEKEEFEYNKILEITLDFIFKGVIRGLSLSVITREIGKIIVEDIIYKYDNIDEKIYRDIGTFYFTIINNLLKEKIGISLVAINTSTIDFEIVNKALEEGELYIDNILFLEYNPKIEEYIKLGKITKEIISSQILLTQPMLVKPKDWQIKGEINFKKLYGANEITHGGYLLNGLWFNKSLQKKKRIS